LLGAIGAGDIGTHFSPSDAQWKGAASERFVRHALQLTHRGGWRLVNLDANLILEHPRIQPLQPQLCERVAVLLGTTSDRISIKAKGPEGMHMAGTAIAQVDGGAGHVHPLRALR